MSRRNSLDRTLLGITAALKETLIYEELAARAGLLQSLDPRSKVLATLALLLVVGLVQRIEVLFVLYLLTIPLVWLGRLPLGTFVRRVWFFMPFFTAAIALPALFVTPGEPALVLLVRPFSLVITVQGARTALTLIMRVATSVSLALLLVQSTRWPALLKALRTLRVPQPFVLILSMTRRYIFSLLQKAEDLLLARRSRMLGRLPARQGRQLAAGMAGTLIARSYQVSQEIYLAMEARGFRGDVRLVEELRWQVRDVVALLVALAIGGGALWLGR